MLQYINNRYVLKKRNTITQQKSEKVSILTKYDNYNEYVSRPMTGEKKIYDSFSPPSVAVDPS